MTNLLRIYLVIFMTTAAEGIVHVIFPPYLNARAFLVSQIGLLSGLFPVLQLAARLPSGTLYTHRRARAVLTAGLALLGLSSIGFAVFVGFVPLVIMIMLHGFAFGAVTTVALALCIDLKPGNYSSGAMMGWYTAAIAAGYSVGQPIGGYLADTFGFGAGFSGTAAFSLLGISAVLTLPTPGGRVTYRQALEAEHQRHRWSFRVDPRRLPASVLLATLIVFFVNLIFRSLHTFFPLYALTMGISLTQYGLLRSLLSLAAAVVRPFSGRLFEVLHYRRVTHIAMVVAAGAVILSSIMVRSMAALVVLYVLMGLSRGLNRVTSATMIAESSDESDSGSIGVWSGIYNAGLDLGSITGPAVGGYLAAVLGIPRMLILLPTIALGVYILVSLTARRRRQQTLAAIE
ncbi:MAG: MFS transporter [Chloroflexi bacterium]|nr:MAG: MFS transporter [Chloroflexota bacterium]